MKLDERERREYRKLGRLWAMQRATLRQMLRCMELDHKAKAINPLPSDPQRARQR